MNFTFSPTPTAPAVVRPLVQNDALTENLARIALETGLAADALTGDFKADFKEILPLYQLDGRKLLLLGLGKSTDTEPSRGEPSRGEPLKSGQIIRAFRALFFQQKTKLPAHVSLDLRGCPAEWLEWDTWAGSLVFC
ncbi:MAG: hypothetical protein H7Y12_13005 [Sphingobacteriaceae bacterium]|nr:hypothetical protein [Cytophagaceae bacterium]